MPTPRQDLANSFFERLTGEWEELRQMVIQETEEHIKWTARAAALHRGLGMLLESYDKKIELSDTVSSNIRALLSDTEPAVCSCGHLLLDHDERGCLYMGCLVICGKDVER